MGGPDYQHVPEMHGKDLKSNPLLVSWYCATCFARFFVSAGICNTERSPSYPPRRLEPHIAKCFGKGLRVTVYGAVAPVISPCRLAILGIKHTSASSLTAMNADCCCRTYFVIQVLINEAKVIKK